MKLVSHLKSLWGPWWPLPGGLLLAYGLVVAALGDLRPEHGVLTALCLSLAYATARTREFFAAVSPYVITGVAYDALRYPRKAWVTAPRVLGCDLREFEVALFGVGPGTTLQDWFAVHHHPALDLLSAVPYFVFVYVVLAYALFLYFADRPRMQRYLWAYAIANLIAFVFYLGVPAAPPWYLRAHGCTIDIAAAPSPAALVRVDALLGISYFSGFYSRSNSVFGALPSMHCAFPLIGLLTAWRHVGWRTRPIHLAYVLSMAFAAVYLDHHWVIDVLAGWAVAAVSVALAGRAVALWRRGLSRRRGAVAKSATAPARGSGPLRGAREGG